MNSSAAKNVKGLSGKKNEKAGRNQMFMPISIGNAGVASLVSSKPLNN